MCFSLLSMKRLPSAVRLMLNFVASVSLSRRAPSSARNLPMRV